MNPYRIGKAAPSKQTYREWLFNRSITMGIRYGKWLLIAAAVYVVVRGFWWVTGPNGCGCHT